MRTIWSNRRQRRHQGRERRRCCPTWTERLFLLTLKITSKTAKCPSRKNVKLLLCLKKSKVLSGLKWRMLWMLAFKKRKGRSEIASQNQSSNWSIFKPSTFLNFLVSWFCLIWVSIFLLYVFCFAKYVANEKFLTILKGKLCERKLWKEGIQKFCFGFSNIQKVQVFIFHWYVFCFRKFVKFEKN